MTDKLKDKAKEAAGDVTNDKETKTEVDQDVGKVKEITSDVKKGRSSQRCKRKTR